MSDTPENNPAPDEAAQAGETADDSALKPKKQPRKSTRFIVRGMATLLPAVLTLWLLVFAYGFVRDKIAAPINWGVQGIVIQFTDWPIPTDEDFADVWQSEEYLTATQREAWEDQLSNFGELNDRERRDRRLLWMKGQPEVVLDARRVQLEKKWNSIAIGQWQVLDIIGLVIAIILFYFAGALMSNVIGRQIKNRGEKIIDRVPLIRRVYPAVKQVTDFFFGDSEQQIKFNRVVAVEYPRKGLYSVGLVTGDTMQTIEDAMGEPCLTVFVPSSPTPFTGYVITVPVADTIDLGITIEDALKFAVSGGVLVPPSQTIDRSNKPYDRRSEAGDRRALPGSSGNESDPS
ncbi:MAG: DUF502 domain-containing protein [Planctomycetota bacterium]